jgi:hypothetical protein
MLDQEQRILARSDLALLDQGDLSAIGLTTVHIAEIDAPCVCAGRLCWKQYFDSHGYIACSPEASCVKDTCHGYHQQQRLRGSCAGSLRLDLNQSTHSIFVHEM